MNQMDHDRMPPFSPSQPSPPQLVSGLSSQFVSLPHHDSVRVMIFAAGEGRRLRPWTLTCPKPLIPFLGVPLIEYSLGLLRESHFALNRLIVNVFHLGNQMRRHVELWGKEEGVPTGISDEREEGHLLGSGGGLRKAAPLLLGGDEDLNRVNSPPQDLRGDALRSSSMSQGQPLSSLQGKSSRSFFLMNGDEVILPRAPHLLSRLFQAHTGGGPRGESSVCGPREQRPLCTLLVMEHPDVGKQFGGVWCTRIDPQDGISSSSAGGEDPESSPHTLYRVRGFSKSPLPEGIGLHFLGVYLLEDRIFQYFDSRAPDSEENLLYETLTRAMEAGETVQAYRADVDWFEVGSKTDFLEAAKILEDWERKGPPPPSIYALTYLQRLQKTREPSGPEFRDPKGESGGKSDPLGS